MLVCSALSERSSVLLCQQAFYKRASLCLFTVMARQPNSNGKHFLIKLLITLALMLEIKAHF